MENEERWLTLTQAANLAGVSRPTLKQLPIDTITRCGKKLYSRADAMSQPMMPKEAARMLGVNIGTLARWAEQGKIDCVKSARGHRRYNRDEIEQLATKEGKQ